MENVVMLVVAVSLTACGRVELSHVDAATPVIQTVAAEDGGDMTVALMAERRHFAIYSASRTLFDASADMYRSSGDGSGTQHELDAGVQACTVRAMPD